MQPSTASPNPLQRWVHWAPLWLGAGVALYFRFPFEPPLAWAWGLLAFLPLLWWARHQLRGLAVVLAMAAMALGFCAGIWQTSRVAAPVLLQPLEAARIEGRVRDITIEGRRQKITLDEVRIEGLPPERTPRRVRVSAALGAQELGIGERIQARAGLSAPARPVMPGGFDFGRYFLFREVGAIGYVIPPVSIVSSRAETATLNAWMTRQRLALKRYLLAVLPEPANALAVAYVTGDQAAVSEAIQENMRVAGLSHILAISGMHMTIVCGIVYFIIRLVLAAIPALALRYDIRKGAALFALLSGGLYLWLADFPVSAVRAYVMIAVFFSAILAGREADGLRSLVIAAIALLLVQPSSLLEPGFQLSFAAVLALILFYRWWNGRREGEGWEVLSLAMRVGYYFLGLLMTTLVAGFATAPIAAYHFHQFSTYGLLANTFCIPLVSFLVTPALMLALLLAPIGAQEPFLAVTGWGFETMTNIAAHAAALPGALLSVPPMPDGMMAAMLMGGIVMMGAKLRYRLAGVAMVVACLIVAMLSYQPPDMLVASDVKAIAMRKGDAWELLKGTSRNFAVEEWQNALGVTMTPGLTDRCDRAGCIHALDPRVIALPRYERALVEDCQLADLVMTEKTYRGDCSARLLDGEALRRYGTHAIRLERRKLKIWHGCSGIARRPWNRC